MKFRQLKSKMLSALGALAIGLAVAMPVYEADAATRAKLTMKDGTTVEGDLFREVDGLIWIKVMVNGKEETKMFTSSDYSKFEKLGDAAPAAATPAAPTNPAKTDPKPAEAAPASTPAPTESKPRTGNRVPRAAVLTLGEGGDKDMVGIYVMSKPLRDAIPLLKKDNVDIVVFRVNSGGGAL
ncbi:MAG: hypothetical protein ACKO40_01605, partial [Planctomycetaceae bacterium]